MWTHLGVDFGLAAAATVGAVIVGAGIGIFMNSVQKPEEELEGIMLRISPKLRTVFGHNALKREEISQFFCHFGWFLKSLNTDILTKWGHDHIEHRNLSFVG